MTPFAAFMAGWILSSLAMAQACESFRLNRWRWWGYNLIAGAAAVVLLGGRS